jgi:flagellar basal-body rod protein FlgG
MLRALYSASAGMQSQQLNLDVIANNLANVNTTGFKKTKIEFQDLLYQTTRAAGADQGGGNILPTSSQIGHGSQLAATAKIFTTGELTSTGEEKDLAIQGDGFFKIQLPDGTDAYSRDGGFKLASDGRLTTSEGYPLLGGVGAVPAGTTGLTIAPSGEVTASTQAGTQNLGRLQLYRFGNPGGLDSQGGNLYKDNLASGQALAGNPGENGFGTVRQGYLEMSNVKVVEEMVNLIVAQRAYEVNAKAVQAADEMMQLSNNLRR